MTRTIRVIVTGRAQGVGYRAWVEQEARARGLSGWVRNRRDGSVEALFSGHADAVEAMTRACRTGSRLARVETILVEATPDEPAGRGFRTIATT